MLMHRRRIELALDALEMIEPLDGAIEFGAFLLGELGFHAGNLVGEFGLVQILQRSRYIGQYGEALVGDFGEAAEHDDFFARAADDYRENSRPDRRHYR